MNKYLETSIFILNLTEEVTDPIIYLTDRVHTSDIMASDILFILQKL